MLRPNSVSAGKVLVVRPWRGFKAEATPYLQSSSYLPLPCLPLPHRSLLEPSTSRSLPLRSSQPRKPLLVHVAIDRVLIVRRNGSAALGLVIWRVSHLS